MGDLGGLANDLAAQALADPDDCLQSLRDFNLSFLGSDQEVAMRWPYNWSLGLILGAFCTIFRA